MQNKLETMLRRGAAEGIRTLRAICADGDKKDADRIAAAKALLDYGFKKEHADGADTLRVVLENVPDAYLA